VPCRWTESERFTRRKLEIVPDPERWDALLRTIEDDLMRHPEWYPRLPDSDLPWRMLKTRPGTAGFPGLVIYFSIQSTDVCVLEDVDLSDHQDATALLDVITKGSLYGWAHGNGQAEF
jgi:hypothetical protein